VQALDRTPACRHLAGPLDCEVTYYRWLTGVGLEAELLCAACAARREAGRALEIVSICDACLSVLEDELGDPGGFRGTPGLRVRLETIDETIDEAPLPWPLEKVLDIAPIEAEKASWLVVLRDGTVQRLDADSRSADHVCSIDLPRAEPDHKPWNAHVLTPRLHPSLDATFAAVVHDYGKHGRVYDLRTGRCTIELNGGGYYPETVPFSFAFVEHRDRTVAIHRNAWNRLDASDAATGQLLTDRGPTNYRRGEPRPEHYLDYFHGRLVVSPDGQRIVDDGWQWHPTGIPTVWDLGRWLDTNPWESEDGPSRMPLAYRDYYWDHEMCWLDSERIALSGIGEDDDWMIDGARVFTAAEADPAREAWRLARELGAFAGPSGRLFGDSRRLFSAGEDGLTIWDVEAGALLARIDGFTPSCQHSHGRELVEVSGQRLLRWRY
jgi:hypothetical protein